MADAIRIEGVRKAFGRMVAVDRFDLAVPQGALYGFIGPNGAGKTTTLRMIMSILFPDVGEISVLGNPSALDAKDRIGYLPEERGVYKKMRVGAFLRFMARLKGVTGSNISKSVREWLERVELADVANKKCEELSKGMQQKIQFIAAVIHQPDLLILDEPFSGLDPVNMRLLRDLIQEQHERGTTIIFSTHVMVQAEELCDHLVMIHRGKKVLDATLADIRSDFDPRAIRFEALDPKADLSHLAKLPWVERSRIKGSTGEFIVGKNLSPADAMKDLMKHEPAAKIEVHRPSLEDIFIKIVADSGEPISDEPAGVQTDA